VSGLYTLVLVSGDISFSGLPGAGWAKFILSLGGNIEGHLIRYYINMVGITDTENVLPIMHFQDNGFRKHNKISYFVTAEDAIFGIRSTRNNTRAVLLGMSPYIMTDENVRRTLIQNILDWLAGGTGAGN